MLHSENLWYHVLNCQSPYVFGALSRLKHLFYLSSGLQVHIQYKADVQDLLNE